MPNPMHLKPQEAEAVLTVSNRPEYEVVEEYLLRRRKLLLEKLATCQDSTNLRVLQGRVQELDDIIALQLRAATYLKQQ